MLSWVPRNVLGIKNSVPTRVRNKMIVVYHTFHKQLQYYIFSTGWHRWAAQQPVMSPLQLCMTARHAEFIECLSLSLLPPCSCFTGLLLARAGGYAQYSRKYKLPMFPYSTMLPLHTLFWLVPNSLFFHYHLNSNICQTTLQTFEDQKGHSHFLGTHNTSCTHSWLAMAHVLCCLCTNQSLKT